MKPTPRPTSPHPSPRFQPLHPLGLYRCRVIVVYNTPIELPVQKELQALTSCNGRQVHAVHVTASRSKAHNLEHALTGRAVSEGCPATSRGHEKSGLPGCPRRSKPSQAKPSRATSDV